VIFKEVGVSETHELTGRRLAGNVAVVTGASRGIGAGVARALLDRGMYVAGAARDEDGLRTVLGDAAEDGRALAVPTDVTDARAVDRLFARTLESYGRVDVLVAAAGVLRRGALEDLSLEAWQESLAVNLTGVFLCSQAAVRRMLLQEPLSGGLRGHVVHLVSGAGVHGWVGAGAYSAGKFGVMGLSEVLREEVRSRGIRVTQLLPGPVDTPMIEHPDFDDRKKLAVDDVVYAVLAVLEAPAHVAVNRLDVRHRETR
jgi:NAD(P)-dependent dehydrogenase (short-subunit alcohol dehydrogenase family)